MARVIEQGRRAYLRAPRASDRDEFLRLARASRELHRPWVYAPETPREFDAYLVRCSERRPTVASSSAAATTTRSPASTT